MNTQDKGLLKSVLGFLSIPLGILFFFGILLNYDGVLILVNKNNYSQGVLKADSMIVQPKRRGNRSVIYFYGKTDSLSTSITLGETGTHFIDSIFQKYSETKNVDLPIWFKPDGNLSLNRFPEEKIFPFNKILTKVVRYIFFFNVPFIVIFFWIRFLNKKENQNAP